MNTEPSLPSEAVYSPEVRPSLPIKQLFIDSWNSYTRHIGVLSVLFGVPGIFFVISQLFLANENLLWGLVSLGISLVLFVPASAASVLVVVNDAELFDSLKQGWRLFLPLLWYGLLSQVVVLGGLLMFIIPELLMSIWFSFSLFVFVLEGKRGLAVLTQSREYTRGYWWAIFFRALLLYILFAIPFYAFSPLIIAAFGETIALWIGYVFGVLSIQFMWIYMYTMYRSLTVLKPTLAATTATTNRKFFIVSGLIGVVAWVVGIVAVGSLISMTLQSNSF